MFDKKTVKDVDVRGKRVLVRVDFNVPLAEGTVTDDTRVRAALPTLRYLVDHGARVIVISHLGRPKGAPDPQFSLRPVRRVLQRLMGRNVVFVDDVVGPEAQEAVARMVDGEIVMLENVRFEPGEKANDPEFAKNTVSSGSGIAAAIISANFWRRSFNSPSVLPFQCGRFWWLSIWMVKPASPGSPESGWPLSFESTNL